jgi:hypothetical protein
MLDLLEIERQMIHSRNSVPRSQKRSGPVGIGAARLTVARPRLIRLARQCTAGRITRARLAAEAAN